MLMCIKVAPSMILLPIITALVIVDRIHMLNVSGLL